MPREKNDFNKPTVLNGRKNDGLSIFKKESAVKKI